MPAKDLRSSIVKQGDARRPLKELSLNEVLDRDGKTDVVSVEVMVYCSHLRGLIFRVRQYRPVKVDLQTMKENKGVDNL